MSRSISIVKGYMTHQNDQRVQSIYTDGYTHFSCSSNGTNKEFDSINKVLPPEIDIFSSLPDKIYDIEHARLFLHEMKKVLLNLDKAELGGISLPKLQVTEFTDMTIVIEWIFNYFRLYFSFDKKEGDFFGYMMSDIENGRFRNDFKKMELSQFGDVAESQVDYAILMAEGGE